MNIFRIQDTFFLVMIVMKNPIKRNSMPDPEFSARFMQFKQFKETSKLILYPDIIPFDKLN